MKREDRLKSTRRVSLIEVVVVRGEGTESDPARTVTMLFTDDGGCVAEHDPIFPTPWYAPTETCEEVRR